MYEIGEYVNYGTHGICQIEDIRTMDFGTGKREYYVLQPIAQNASTFYLPRDNPRTQERLRPVLTPESINTILSNIHAQRMPWIEDRKQRQLTFQQILSGRDTTQLLSLSACLHQRLTQKGLSFSDREILSKAEEMIEQEFSFALKLRPEEIGGYIRERV